MHSMHLILLFILRDQNECFDVISTPAYLCIDLKGLFKSWKLGYIRLQIKWQYQKFNLEFIQDLEVTFENLFA